LDVQTTTARTSTATAFFFLCSFSLPKLGELELKLLEGLIPRDVLRGVAGLALKSFKRGKQDEGGNGESNGDVFFPPTAKKELF